LLFLNDWNLLNRRSQFLTLTSPLTCSSDIEKVEEGRGKEILSCSFSIYKYYMTALTSASK
jgi:hypothetical protein